MVDCNMWDAFVQDGGRTEACGELSGGMMKSHICKLQKVCLNFSDG